MDTHTRSISTNTFNAYAAGGRLRLERWWFWKPRGILSYDVMRRGDCCGNSRSSVTAFDKQQAIERFNLDVICQRFVYV